MQEILLAVFPFDYFVDQLVVMHGIGIITLSRRNRQRKVIGSQ